MKNIKYIFLFIFLAAWCTSCDHDELLTEVPKDFLSPEVSFTNKASFDAAVIDVNRRIRDKFIATGDGKDKFPIYGVDVDIAVRWNTTTSVSEHFNWNTLNSDNGISSNLWATFYNWIYHTNVIIGRVDDDVVKWTSEEEKNAIVGEAKFLRAFAYHFLANMWGGVPIVLEETAAPKFDYKRATREEVYKQCKKDLEFATKWMPIEDVTPGGRPPRAAAYHLLSEVNICLGDYKGAIDAASAVINNPAYELMIERFGVYEDFKFQGYDYQGPAEESWGDVYWDLFREGNFNRVEGNKECIWNGQMDYSLEGGGGTGDASWGGKQVLERRWNPQWWRIKDVDNVKNWLKDTLCGRPDGGAYVTDYTVNQIWQYKGDWDKDIRNSKYNIQREYYWTNPNSQFYGEVVKEEQLGDPGKDMNHIMPSYMKFTTCLHHGTAIEDGSGQDYGRTYKDWYLMRLAETYLLRAEAYYLKGENQKAADDINEVRNRAKATPVSSGDVNLDLILDERARELHGEDFRLSTLLRMGKLKEYVQKYNSGVILNGYTLNDRVNLLPIPESEIEKNTEVVLEQNPGY